MEHWKPISEEINFSNQAPQNFHNPQSTEKSGYKISPQTYEETQWPIKVTVFDPPQLLPSLLSSHREELSAVTTLSLAPKLSTLWDHWLVRPWREKVFVRE